MSNSLPKLLENQRCYVKRIRKLLDHPSPSASEGATVDARHTGIAAIARVAATTTATISSGRAIAPAYATG